MKFAIRGPLSLCAEAEAAKPTRGAPQRLAAAPFTSFRVPCAARVRGPAGNSLRSLRSLRSDTPAFNLSRESTVASPFQAARLSRSARGI